MPYLLIQTNAAETIRSCHNVRSYNDDFALSLMLAVRGIALNGNGRGHVPERHL